MSKYDFWAEIEAKQTANPKIKRKCLGNAEVCRKTIFGFKGNRICDNCAIINFRLQNPYYNMNYGENTNVGKARKNR